jgi:hypothetical protein
MTDIHADHPDLDLRAELARIDRDRAETEKLFEESRKFRIEQDKLFAEALKLRGDSRWQPVIVVAGALASFATLLAVLFKL